MMTSSCLKLNNLLYLLVKDSCIIFILFLSIYNSFTFLDFFLNLAAGDSWSVTVAQTRFLLRATPINWRDRATSVSNLEIYVFNLIIYGRGNVCLSN